jgi:hypothetical protein
MRGLDGIAFDTTGLALQGDQQNTRTWTTAAGDQVVLYDLPPQPDCRPVAAALDNIRAKSRAQAAKYAGAIVEVELCAIAGFPGIREILKIPRKPTGMMYVGSLMLPLPDGAYFLTAACFERGITGMRDAMIFAKLMQSGEIQLPEGEAQPAGWMCDPYDPTIAGPPARTRADDEAYDEIFPDHPLSHVRTLLRQIGGSLRLVGAATS